MLCAPMNNRPPKTKREHLRQLVREKQNWSEPLSVNDQIKGFHGWHERGYLPHCDKPGLVQFITFRLADSLPASRRSEWEHLLGCTHQGAQSIALREQRLQLETFLDCGHGECHLRNPQIAKLVEQAMRFHHQKRFALLAWVVMPNHVHVLVEIWETPLSKVLQNWKSITAVAANKLLERQGVFWQPEYWDRFMRTEEQARKAIRYIENNPVKAKLCLTPEEWLFGSARFRNPQTRQLNLPD